MRSIYRLSIKHQFSIALLAVVLFLIGSMSVVQYFYFNNCYEKLYVSDTESKLNLLVSYIELDTAYAVSIPDKAVLHSEFSFITVLDTYDRVVYQFPKQGNGLLDSFVESVQNKNTFMSDTMYVQKKLLSISDSTELVVVAGNSVSVLSDTRGRILVLSIVMTIVLMALVFIYVNIIGKVVREPLISLENDILRIVKKDDISTRVHFPYKTEIGSLYSAVNSLLEAVQIRDWKRDEAEVALRFSEKRHRALFEHSATATAVLSVNGDFIQVNLALAMLFGMSEKELLEKNILDFYPRVHSLNRKDEMKSLLANAHSRNKIEKIFIGKNDTHISTIFNYSVLDDSEGDPYLIIATFSDISSRKLAEEQVQKLNVELEERVEQRTRELIELNKQLSEAQYSLKSVRENAVTYEKNASLGYIVAGIAQEMNAPITVASSAIGFWSERTSAVSNAKENHILTNDQLDDYLEISRESTAMISHNIEKIADLVQAFRSVSEDQACLVKKDFLVKEYINHTLKVLKPHLKKRGIHVMVDCVNDLTVSSYPGELAKILTNLVVHSLSHPLVDVPKPWKITISVSKSNDSLCIIYRDSGSFALSNSGISFEEQGEHPGLFMVNTAVKQKLKGDFCLDHDTNGEAAFKITIPVIV